MLLLRSMPLLLLAACATPSAPVPQRTDVKPLSTRYSDEVLPSGLRLIIEEAPGTGHVQVVTVVSAGPDKDPEGRAGLAHLLEHLVMLRSRSDGLSRIQELEALGAAAGNASTSENHVLYSTVGPRALLTPLVGLLGELITRPLDVLDARELEVEKSVVIAERNFRIVNEHSQQALLTAFFGGQAVRSAIGTAQTLGAITVPDLRKFAADHYQPHNATLLVNGDFDAALVRREVLDALPDVLKLPGAPRAPPPPAVRLARRSTDLVFEAQGPPGESRLGVAWAFPEERGGKWTTQRLVERLRATRKWNAVESTTFGFNVVVLVSVSLDEASTPLAQLRQVAGEVEQVLSAPAGEAVSHRALILSQAADWLSRGKERARQAHLTGDARLLGNLAEAERLQARLEAESVSWMAANKARGIVLRPGVPVAPKALSIPEIVEQPLRLVVPASRAAQIAAAPVLPGTRAARLANGLNVVIVPRPAIPQVSIVLARPGAALSTLGLLAETSLPQRRGCDAQQALVLSPTQVNESWVGENVDLECMLALASLRARTPIDPRLFQESKAGFEPLARPPLDLPVLRGALNGAYPSIDEVRAVTLSAVEDYRAAVTEPSRAALVIVGDVDPERALHAVRTAFDAWKGTEAPPIAPLAPMILEPQPAKVVLEPRPEALVTISLGCLVETDPFPNLTTRLTMALLEDRVTQVRTQLGAAYWLDQRKSAIGSANLLQGTLMILPQQLTAGLRFLSEASLAQPTIEDIDRARWKVAHRFRLFQAGTSSEFADWIATGVMNTGSFAKLPQALAKVATVPAKDVQRAWKTCAGTQVWTLTGPEAVTRPAAIAVFGADALK